MKTTIKIILFLLLLNVFSCKKEVVNTNSGFNNYDTINIDVKKKNVIIDLFSGFDIIKIKGDYIGKIRKLEFLPNGNFVFSTSSGKERAHIYNIIKRERIAIINKGNAPKEVSDVTDLSIDKKGNIYILDMRKKSLHIISKEGKYLKKEKLDDFYDEAIITENFKVFMKKVPYGLKDYKITITDNDFNIKKKYLSVPKIAYERDFSQQRSIYKSGDNIMFTQSFSDTIYSINNEKIKTKYLLNFINKQLPYRDYYNKNYDLMKFVQKMRKSNNVWNISSILENDRYMLISFRFGSNKKVFFSFYDKNSKKVRTSNEIDFSKLFLMKNKANFCEDFYPIYMSSKSLYFILEPYYLLENDNNISNISTDYDQNPIILKLNFK